LDFVLTEPLTILLGQTIVPVLVARNLGDRSAFVTLFSGPDAASAQFAGLHRHDNPDSDAFWDLYDRLLRFVASSEEYSRLERNEVTRFYDEVIRSGQGSRWIYCLTVASGIEGLSKILLDRNRWRPRYAPAKLDDLAALVQSWKGDSDLRARVLDSIARFRNPNAGGLLKQWAKAGLVRGAGVDAWKSVRNAVMHGELTAPWSTRDEDQRMRDLVGLFHELTRRILDRKVPGQVPIAKTTNFAP
jgi:hypothetical protein